MSKYVILRLNKKPSQYSTDKGKPFYEIFCHTNTKYDNNEPYFSASLNNNFINRYSIYKEDLPIILKLAQNHIPSYSKVKESNQGKIFVLKTNSHKLKAITKLYK